MSFTNLHTHGKYCDGNGELQTFVESAIAKNMNGIGFSSHAPVPFDNDWTLRLDNIGEYIEDVLSLKKKYKNKLAVYLGLELDYIENVNVKQYIDFDKLPLDYTISAVHFIYMEKLGQYETVDDKKEVFEHVLHDGFSGNATALYTKYYETYRAMISEYQPKIVAHFDIVKKNNKDQKYFREDEREYIRQVVLTLDEIKKHDCIIEINTGGMVRGYTDDTYPSLWILKLCYEKDIKITINSDAHSSENIDKLLDFAILNAKKAQYKFIYQFDGYTFKKQFI